MNESVVFFYCQYVLVNWIYKSRVVLLEQINVLRHQVFVAQNSHKSSLFFVWSRHSFCWCAVSNAVGLGLRGCHLNVRLGRSRSARLITKSVYTGVSEWETHLLIEVPKTNFVSTLRVYHSFKKESLVLWWTFLVPSLKNAAPIFSISPIFSEIRSQLKCGRGWLTPGLPTFCSSFSDVHSPLLTSRIVQPYIDLVGNLRKSESYCRVTVFVVYVTPCELQPQ